MFADREDTRYLNCVNCGHACLHATVVPPPPVGEPEDDHRIAGAVQSYTDTGCNVGGSCLSCRLSACLYESSDKAATVYRNIHRSGRKKSNENLGGSD